MRVGKARVSIKDFHGTSGFKNQKMLCQRVCKRIGRESRPLTIIDFFQSRRGQRATKLSKLSIMYASIEVSSYEDISFALIFEYISDEPMK